MLTNSSPEKSILWNLPQNDERRHFILGTADLTSKDLPELLENAASAKLIGEQRIDDYYYDTKKFALFAKGYACCIRQMLGNSALCLIPVTVLGEFDHARSSMVTDFPTKGVDRLLRISSLESSELKDLLQSMKISNKLHRQFRVRTKRHHFQSKEPSHKISLILDSVSIKSSQGSSLVKSSTHYDELICAPDILGNDLTLTMQGNLKSSVAFYPVKTNAYQRAMEMDTKTLHKIRNRKLAECRSERSGHDLFRAHMYDQLAELQRFRLIALEGADKEGVHQMRIGIRRIRAALNTFAPLLAKSDRQHWHTEYRWLAKRLGSVRDLDVFTDWLAVHKSTANVNTHDYIDAYQNDIGDLYHHARQSLISTMDTDRYRTLIREFSVWIGQEKCFFVNNDLHWQPTEQLADTLIKRAVRRINRKINLIDEQSSAEQLHEFRVECKRARYSLDMLEGFSDKDQKALILSLKQVQEVLGDHQDACDRSKRIRLYAKGQKASIHGQEFLFYLGTIHAEQEFHANKMAKAFFKQQGFAAKTIKQSLQLLRVP